MSRKYSLAEVQAYNEGVRRNRETQRAAINNAMTALGGGNSAPSSVVQRSIPQLEKNLDDLYKSASYEQRQAAASAYNEAKNTVTRQRLSNIGQSVNNIPEISSSRTIMGMGNGAYGRPTQEMSNVGITQEDLQRLLDEKNEEEKARKVQGFADMHPVASTVSSWFTNPVESGVGVLQKGVDYLTKTPMQSQNRATDIIRGTVSQGINVDIPDNYENKLISDNNITKLARLGYNVANSAMDMITAAAMTGGYGTGTAALMGLEKGDSTMNDAIERGLTPNQIMTEGGLSAASTTLAEKLLPINALSNNKNIFLTALSEGIEEGAEDILDMTFDQLVTNIGGNSEKSQFQPYFEESAKNNTDETQATREAWQKWFGEQVIPDMIAGGLTGGALGLTNNIASGNRPIAGTSRIPSLLKKNNIDSVSNINENIEAENNYTVVPSVSDNTDIDINNVKKEAQQNLNSILHDIQTGKIKESDLAKVVKNIYADIQQGIEHTPELRDSYNAMLNKFVQDIKDIPALRKTNLDERVNEDFKENETIDDNIGNNIDGSVSDEKISNNLSSEELSSIVNQTQQDIDALLYDLTAGNVIDSVKAISELRSDMSQTIQQVPELTDRFNEMFAKFANEVRQISPQTEQQTARQIPTLSRITPDQIAQLSNIANQYASNIEMFNVKGTKKYANQIRKAYDKIRTTTGDAQIKAVEDFNNLLDEVNEVMAGEEVGVNARDFNRDFYTQMQEATDGYKIKVSPELQSELENMYGYKGVAKLSDNLFNTGSNNHIKLVSSKYEGGINIGDAYGEIYEASGRMLPNPDGMSDMQKMRALIDYINEYKADKNDMVDTHTWEEMNSSRELSSDEQSAVSLVDDFVDNLVNLNSKEDIGNAFLDLTKAISDINRKNPELEDTLFYLLEYARDVMMDMPESTVSLDEDIQNVQTLEDALTMLDVEIGGLPQNLNFFGSDGDVNTLDNEEYGRVNTGRQKVSEAYTNTGLNSDIMTEEEQNRHESDDSMLYTENAEKESVAEARNRIEKNGFNGEYKRLLNKDGFNNVDVDEAMILWREYSDRVRNAKERGIDYKNDLQKAYDIFTKIKNESSEHGSALQALAKWSRNNTPEGLLSEASAIIRKAKLTKDGTSVDWNQQVAKETKNKTDKMDIDFMDRFLTEAQKLDGLDMDSREARHIMANLGKMVNSQIPITLREKVTTILMDNMLGNARTLLTRNAGGNIGFNLVEDFAKKPLAALIDRGMEKFTGKRTTMGLSSASIKAGWEGFKAGLAQEAYDFKNDIQSARSGENTLATATANNRNALTSKIGKMYNKLVKAGLSVGDRPFYEKTYAMSMAEYERLYKMGKLKDAAGNMMSRQDFEQLAKAYAQLNALTSVYQDNSEIAQAFLGMKEAVNNLSRGVVGADVLSQFTMPFVKTPANIIQRSVEYSPIGIVKNAVQTIRELNHAQTANGKLDFNQARFVNESARNIIGTALFIAGMAMAQSGKMTGGYSDDKDMAQAQKEAGMQEYALHNPFGLNADVDISWLPVLGNNAVAAASAYDAMSNPELSPAQQIGQGLTAGLKSQFESSALQGLQRLVGGSGSFGNEGGDLLSNSVDTLKSGATQFIPSLLRQAATASDPYQRKLSGPNPDDYYINSVLSAIPGLRQTLEPKIGRTGEALEQNHAQTLGGRIFNNFINPATVTYGTEDKVRDEAMRLFESTGNNVAFQPSVTMNELKKDDHVPTAEEFTRYQQQAYGAMNSVATELIDSDYYNSLNDGDKEQLLADTYSAIKTVEKADVLGSDPDNFSGAAKAYYEGGEDGLIEYMTARSALNQMGMQNNEKNREMVLDTLHEGGEEAVNEMVERSQELADAGLDANMQFKYDHATNYIPSLSPTQFAETWNAINTDGNTSIKQQEIIDYLNQKPTSYNQRQAMEYWQAYGSDWKKIPALDPNTHQWKAVNAS